MAGRVVLAVAWYSVIAFTAFAAVCIELDRQGRSDRWVAGFIPGPFQGDALENLTKAAFEREDSTQGEALARKLVERRPIPAEALSLYAYGLLANGKEEAGIVAIQMAAGRGWRDRFVQRVTILSALQQNAPDIAANRVVGLWMLGERSDWLKNLTRTTLMAPGGVSAVAARLSKRDRDMSTDLLIWAAANLPVVIVNRLVGRMAVNGSRFDCAKFSIQNNALVVNGRGSSAVAVWNALCSSIHRSTIDDLDFQINDVLPGPFDWRYPQNPGVDVDLRKERKNVVLQYASINPLLQVIALRYLAFAPGRHLIKANNIKESSGTKLQVVCVVGTGPKANVKLEEIIDGQWSFVVPTSCPVQELSIAVRSGSGEIGPIWSSKPLD